MLLTVVFPLVHLALSSGLPLADEIATDLSHLGERVFGTPSEEAAKKLENWKETSLENPEELSGYAEGDILFPMRSKNGLVAQTSKWKGGIVPYTIDGSFGSSDMSVIKRAIGIYHKYTCIRFRPKEPTDTDYISIVNGPTGCWSSVGRISGKQEINLQSPYCTTKVGTPLHELMHALGFLHEQNRYERDDYVTIAWQNIRSGHDQNFNKAEKDTTTGYGVDYDFRSVMHYSQNAFSSNGRPTIIPKKNDNGVKKMGQREGFSRGDLIKLNTMYNCPNKIPGQVDENNNVENKENGGILSFLVHLFT